MTMTDYASSARLPLRDFPNKSSTNKLITYQKTSPDDKDMLNVPIITIITDKLIDWCSSIPSVKDAGPADVKPNSFYVEVNSGEAENYSYTEINRLLTTFTQIPIEYEYRIELINTFRALNKINERLAQNLAINESLDNALNELAELDDYAAESGFTPPSPVAKEFAKKILITLTSEVPHDYSVSLWEDGDVIIYSGDAEWRVSVYCRTDGGASFYVNSPDGHDHESHYQLAQDILVAPIIDALKKVPA